MRTMTLAGVVGMTLLSVAHAGDCDLPNEYLCGILEPDPGQTTVVYNYVDKDLVIPSDGLTLTAPTTITVTNGRIIVEGPIKGLPPNSASRPDGDAGRDANPLTLRTVCISSGGPGGSRVGSPPCCDIYIDAQIDLSGEDGVEGDDLIGGPGGAGGNGGALRIFSAGDLIIHNNIAGQDRYDTTTRGGDGARGGEGGVNGNGGEGGIGGDGGDVLLRHQNNAPSDALISVTGTITTIGGSGGRGGAAGTVDCGGCGTGAMSGGNGSPGGDGGNISIIARRAHLTRPLDKEMGDDKKTNLDYTFWTSGGAGGFSAAGGDGGTDRVCALSEPDANRLIQVMQLVRTDLPPEILLGICFDPPIHGGNAGSPGSGGDAGNATISATASPDDCGDFVLSGDLFMVAFGGRAGSGREGGSGGGIDFGCDEFDCCGSVGANQPGDPGGSGGDLSVFATLSNLGVTLDAQGGAGGHGGDGASQAAECNECGGTQGAHGGAGGSGGNLTYTAPFALNFGCVSDTPAILVNLLGGDGGDGGDSRPGAPASSPGAAGPDGSASISTSPFTLPVFTRGSKSNGDPGDSGLPCPPKP